MFFFINEVSFSKQKDVLIINDSIKKFIDNATHLGCQQLETAEQSLTYQIEQNMLTRLTDRVPNGVSLKPM